MKKSIFKTALMSAAVLSSVGIFANTAQANAAVKSSATNASQVRGVLTVVDHQKGEVHLYDRDGNIMKQTVKNGKAYKVWEKAMINGELMYRIGTDKQWIPAKYTNWDNAKVGGRVTVALPAKSAVSNRQNYAGAVRVNYQGQGKVRLLNDQGKYVPQYAAKNSTWKVWEKATINDEPMYRIGTQSQWIPAKYVAPVQTTAKQSAPAVHVNTNQPAAKPVVKPVQPVQNHKAVKPATSVVNTGSNHTDDIKPAVPNKPAVPTTPAKPNTGNQSAVKPSQPVKPAQPAVPSKPATPAQSVISNQPVKPAQPARPAQNPNTEKPVAPVVNTGSNHTDTAKPAVPSKPAVPATPAKPNTDNQSAVKPSQPVKPAQPVAPSKPTTPTKPAQPAQPAKPVTPAKPAQAKTGLDAITTDEAAAYAQKLYDQTYERGTLDGYNNAESSNGNSMTVFVEPTDSKSDIYNKIADNYNFWGWSEKDPEYNHAVATATKNYSNNSLEIYQNRY